MQPQVIYVSIANHTEDVIDDFDEYPDFMIQQREPSSDEESDRTFGVKWTIIIENHHFRSI